MKNKKLTRIFYYIITVIVVIQLAILFATIDNSSNSKKYTKDKFKSVKYIEEFNETTSNITGNDYTIFETNIKKDMLGQTLVFYTYHSTTEVYVDDKLIYELKANEEMFKTAATCVNSVVIPIDSLDKTLKVKVKGCYNNIEYSPITFLYGDSLDIAEYLALQELVSNIINIALIIFSMILIIVGIAFYKYKDYISKMVYIGLFLLSYAVWGATDSYIVQYIIQKPITLMILCYLSLYMAPVFILLYIRDKTYGDNIKKESIATIIKAHLSIVLVLELLQLLHIADMREAVLIVHLMIIAEVVLITKYTMVSIYSENVSNKKNIIHKIVMLTTLFAVTYTVIEYTITSKINSTLISLGVLIYSIRLATDIVTEADNEEYLKMQNKELKELAYVDKMTECKNRNAFIHDTKDINIEDKVILSFDMNNLKYYNDNFGHDTGDKLLIQLAKMLKEVFGYDAVYRLGGDEFEIITDTSKNINELLAKFEQLEKEYNASNNLDAKLCAAYGYAIYDENTNTDISDMVSISDKRMYEHKRMLKL